MSIRDKILIYCDFFPSSGVGHLKRCIVLAKELYKRGLDPTFLISSNVGEPPIALPFHIERCSLDNKSILSAEEIIKLAYRDRVQTVIIDSYKISENWISKLISANLTVVAIDDLGIAGNATMRIDYSPNPKLITENCLNLLGPKYFLTDSTSKVYRSMTPQKIIAHAGSLGNFADAPIIYLTAARVFKTFGFEISWLSPNKVSYQWLEENELITDTEEIIGWQKNNQEIWQEYDIVLGPAGTSLFEAILQGALPISFPISKTQTSDRNTWLALGHCLHLTSDEVSNDEIIKKIVHLSLNNYQLFQDLLREKSRDLDAKGTSRVADAIVNTISNRAFDLVEPPTGNSGIRSCTISDAQNFLNARNAPYIRKLSIDDKHIITWPEHIDWWLNKKSERFLIEENGEIKAFFWHRTELTNEGDYLVGGWFPTKNRQSFGYAIRLLEWQLEYCNKTYKNHIWLAIIRKNNKAVLALNRRYGFTEATEPNKSVAKFLFPQLNEDFIILQRRS